MVEIADIKDRESLKEWLNTFSDDEEVRRKAAVDIAVRVALRVLPVAWEWFSSEDARKRDMTALPVLRSSLLACVVRKMPTQSNRKAAHAAADRAVANVARAAVPAANAINVANAAAARGAANTANAASAAAAAAAAEIWPTIRTDCQVIFEGKELDKVAI